MTLHLPRRSPVPPQAFGPDPELLRRVSRHLTPEQARHVAVLTADGITANSAALAGALVFHRFHPLTAQATNGDGGGLGGLVSGVLGGAPATVQGVQVSCKDERSGPYRRVFSKPGYAYQSSQVYLPSADAGEVHEAKEAGHGDTAFIYMGGWGGKGGAVDAGVQHGRYVNGPHDDWAPFFLVQQPGGPSAVTVSDQRQAGGDPWRLASGQNAILTFWVSTDADLTVLNLFIRGTTNLDHSESTLTLSAPVDSSFGWTTADSAAGGANILKRMTTIGQTTGNQNLQSGSFLRGVNWQSSAVGTSEADAQPWKAEQTGGYCSFPAPDSPEGVRGDGLGPKWKIEFRDAGSETDSVELV